MSETKVPARLAASETSLLGSQTDGHLLPVSSHGLPSACVCAQSPLHIGAPAILDEGPP